MVSVWTSAYKQVGGEGGLLEVSKQGNDIDISVFQKERSSAEDALEAGGQLGVGKEREGRGPVSAAIGGMERRGCI